MKKFYGSLFALAAAIICMCAAPTTQISAKDRAAASPQMASPNGLAEGRLMRFPDVYKDKIVFTYAGDLWLVTTSGGVAHRITSHPGQELFAKFSPDGKWIAFTGQYDGNFNVFVMPSDGGEPRQLTFETDQVAVGERMGPNNQVVNWMPDSKSIVYLSRRTSFNDWFPKLFTVNVEGGLPVQMAVDKGGLASFSPDGTQMVYNRIYRNFRTWKRYTGGMTQAIWLYDFKNVKSEALTPTDHTYTYPMWRGNTLYFGSDRGDDHRFNLYSMDMTSKQMKELTHFTDYDMSWPGLGPDSIVMENGGYLYLFDLKSQESHKLTIYLPGDREELRPHWVDASKLITDFDISPDGKRAALSARGDIFTLPAKYGSARNITHSTGTREHGVAWSPDGKWLAYISDRTGEDELFIQAQDGLSDAIEITSGDKGFMFAPQWSPDSKKLAYSDQKLRLWYVDVDAKKPVLADTAQYNEIGDYAWSPDSKWISYTKVLHNHNGVVELYSLASSKVSDVTNGFTSSNSPSFDPAGKYLYFISNRDYNEILGGYDSEFSNTKTSRVYITTLRADEPSPFAPRSDETAAASKDEKKEDADKDKDKDKSKDQNKSDKDKKDEKKSDSAEDKEKEKAAKDFRIDLEGIADRIVALPPPTANISEVAAGNDQVLYVTQPIFGLSGPVTSETAAIHAFDMKDRTDAVLVAGGDGFAISADKKKILYSVGANHVYGIVDTNPVTEHHSGDGALELNGMRMEVDPREEYKNVFNEAWRQERDYFFEAEMNGVNWDKERERYAALLPYAATRYDLILLIGDMIGELSNSHTYVGGGDSPDLSPVNVGMLGVDFALDSASGRYKFAKIYPGENWDPARRSPLTESGVNVKSGDYLLAVNGRPLKSPTDPYELFVGTVGQNVTLTVNSSASETGARNVVVRPIGTEYTLRELDWIVTNRHKVDAATDGKVGYVYIPNMGDEGLNEFVKQYFPQIRKEGMIIDVRYNGGGFVDFLIFERLRRVIASMATSRNFGDDTDPANTFYGSMICITNEYAASDGDFFSFYFKKYKLGPLVGMRTWGGVRGIRGDIPLIDGGYITRPEFSIYGMDSEWVVENHGVDPDVVVDNPPDQVMKGHDPQLEKTIEMVLQDMKEHPKKLPPRPKDLPAYPQHGDH